uniref:Large ribosomal subunit protein bL32c n=1 Tax=Dionaea muscipula TaxID=4362 RepID=A0A1Z2RR90_DIOMU|nr:ribosomal protein L32 [Dionaea muscipula]ASA46346.1 ribosomal protein L32 [Dionaea muscipula]QBC71770.1 ribosomal protein L32 [Dionaea muscipula]
MAVPKKRTSISKKKIRKSLWKKKVYGAAKKAFSLAKSPPTSIGISPRGFGFFCMKKKKKK